MTPTPNPMTPEQLAAFLRACEAMPAFADAYGNADDHARYLINVAFAAGFSEGETDGLRTALETIGGAVS